jgi:hypothetical protein
LLFHSPVDLPLLPSALSPEAWPRRDTCSFRNKTKRSMSSTTSTAAVLPPPLFVTLPHSPPPRSFGLVHLGTRTKHPPTPNSNKRACFHPPSLPRLAPHPSPAHRASRDWNVDSSDQACIRMVNATASVPRGTNGLELLHTSARDPRRAMSEVLLCRICGRCCRRPTEPRHSAR